MGCLRSLWIALPGVLACAGCGTSRATGARAQFAQDQSCPKDRITVGARPLLAADSEPPAAIAADPQRLAMWRAKDAERHRNEESKTYYLATGCGQSRIYDCYYCVEMPDETDCGMAPNCDVRSDCRESRSQPGYVVCDGSP